MWQNWINFLAGIWVIISPYALTGDALKTNLIISGIVIAVLALWSAVSRPSRMMA